ncbi:anthocyanidin 3-O-glucoside 6''-O-acyltransferase-like [Miscanthus floridulus]|uniref:anthocyanidin 3-O-glucoside 6''-O-acyltransferase-like n=1 Tax=Miscanthus floridulus TaxID=154761 RepID=UPI00345A7CD1
MSMSSSVRVLNVTHVLPDQNRAALYSPSPQLPLPDDDGIMKLTFMDSQFVGMVMPMRRLFLYEGPGVPPFPYLVGSLRSSLATVLAIFFPLAGKLTYRPSAGDVVVDCSPAAVSPGVKFVEAEYAGSIDDMRSVASGGGDEGDRDALMELGPELDARQLPAPVIAVQVTRPAVGSGRAVVVAVAIHHAVADGHSVWQFMRAWTAVARAEEGSEAMERLVPPTFDRTVIRYPEADKLASKILRAIAPALPVVRSPSSCSPPDRSRRSFLIHADEIQSVKQHIRTQTETAVAEQLDTPPSTYVAVSSLVWTSIVRAKSRAPHLAVAGDAYCYFFVAVDYRRRRLGPQVNERYFGNCVVPCVATAAARDLCGDAGLGLARAATAIRDAIRAQPEDPVRAMESWLDSTLALPKERFTLAGSSNRFMAYETDFGWGAPSRVELVSLFATELVLLLGAEDGGVQVTVTLDPEHMEGFAANLLRLRPAGSRARERGIVGGP